MLKYLFILLLVDITHQCGVTTHNVIANTALDWLDEPTYKQIITDNLGAFQAGAAFPDWGYDCIMKKYDSNLHEGSEIAHWLPFQKELIKYIRDTNDNPELIALLFGIVSHSVADVIWHDLGYIHPSHQGFITALGNSNCKPGCEYSPHTISDVGGEFVAAYQTNLSFLQNEWSLPTKDIINVYKRMGYFFNYSEVVLDICVAELYTEVQAISKLASELLLAYYDKVAPFLLEEYQGWWLGGIDSNALWTVFCWNSTIDWLKHGIPSDNPPYCYPLTGTIDWNVHTKREIQSRQYLKAILKRVTLNQYKPTQTKLVPKDLPHNSRFGHSIVMCDLTGDGQQDIIVGAPNANMQRGAVYVYNNITTEPIQIKHNSTPGSQFGYSIVCIDINKDGYNDLIIGAPGFNNYPNMTYSGAIHIFHDYTITGVKYANYGNVLNKGDLNGDGYDDLIIGVPYSTHENGAVWYILSGSDLQPHRFYTSTDFWSWFGYKSRVIYYNNTQFLLVSSPNYNNGTNAVGKLTCFTNTGNIIWELVGVTVNGKCSMAFDTFKNVLVVSSPTMTIDLINQGVVHFLPLDQLFKMRGKVMIDKLSSSMIKGGTFYSRLGWDLHYSNDKLVVSAPYYDGRGQVQVNGVSFVGEQHSQFGYSTVLVKNLLLVGAPRENNGVVYAYPI